MGNITLRKATLADASALSKVHVQSWKETYINIIDPHFLYSLNDSDRTKMWENNLSRKEFHAFVAINSVNKIVGFASIAPREYFGKQELFLKSMYLLHYHQGTGVGRRLMDSSLKLAKNLGYTSIFIEVLADNPTIGFYERYSPHSVEERSIRIGGQVLKERILKINLILLP